MGDHYCCSVCHQHYNYCKCDEVKNFQPIPRRIDTTLPAIDSQKTIDEVKLSLEDIRYFHDKFQKYQDPKTAFQLVTAVDAFIELKGK